MYPKKLEAYYWIAVLILNISYTPLLEEETYLLEVKRNCVHSMNIKKQ